MALFGRTEPLAAAARALEGAAAGRGSTLVVSGEAGIGKSALARTLAAEAEARGARVGFGRAWEVGDAPTYWPWTQALAELGLELDELLGSASGEMANAQRLVSFHRVVRAVCAVEGPLVVVILDDLHAADVASLELALAFARGIARTRALLIVTTRESELAERRDLGELIGKLTREGVAIPLRRLDPSATQSWLASVGFQGDAAEVHRLSEGNPLFIEEAVRLGVDRFATAATGGVTVILAEHLARISPKTREILAVASVLGREASRGDVAALGDVTLDDVESAAREGQVAGVLSAAGGDALLFSHLLLRDSLYATLAPSRRARFHARAADGIEARGGPPALTARHLLAAGEAADAGRVARTVCSAAEAAVARHAADSAVELVARTKKQLAGRLDEVGTLVLDLAEVDASMRAAPSDEGRTRAADCAARAERHGLAAAQARAALAYGREVITAHVDPRMVSLLEDALARLPHEERSLRAQIRSRLAVALSPARSEEELRRSFEHAREAVAIAREVGHGPTLLQALVWLLHGPVVYCISGEERVELTSEIVFLARQQGDDLILAEVGPMHALSLRECGRLVAARHEAEEYWRLMDAMPLPILRWKATALRATMAALDGRIEEARRHADVLRGEAAVARRALDAWAFFEIALAACTGDHERLRQLDGQLISILAGRPYFVVCLACVDALLGRRDEARGRLDPVALERSVAGIYVAAQTAVFLQSQEFAEAFYGLLTRGRVRGRFLWGPAAVFPIGPASRLLGELALVLGDHERAKKHFDAAIVECRELESPHFLALSEAGRARAGGPAAPQPRQPPPPSAEVCLALAREGDVWAVSWSARSAFRVKHGKGMDYLQHLLQNPGREVYVLALAGGGEGPEDAGAILDERAKHAYRRRADDLQDQLAEAERLGDRGRAARAREELEALAGELAAAVGLGGRDRKAASNLERARINVQRRIKDAIRHIAEHDAALGRYLDATVRTGTYCVYRPV